MTSPAPAIPPPDEAQWQESIRRPEIARYAYLVHTLAEKVKLTEDFATNTPRKLASLISETARFLADRISSAPATSLHEVNDLLGRISAHLRYVERARVAQTPWSLIALAEYFLTQQAGPKTGFIIRPTWSYNYSIIGEFVDFYKVTLGAWPWFPLDELLLRLSQLRPLEKLDPDESIYCISFPRVEKQNSLLHANWGHELGHIIASQWVADHFASLWSTVQPDIQKRIEDQVRKNPPPLEPLFKEFAIQQVVAQQTRSTMDAARSGLIELVCDAIGAHLFGTAAIAAATQFAARFALDVSPLECEYYPPWRYRIRRMLDYCKDDLETSEKGSPYPSNRLAPFIRWLVAAREIAGAEPDLKTIDSSIVTREAYSFINSHWSSIRDQALSALPPSSRARYSLRDRHAVIDGLVERLEQNVPPNELGNLSDEPIFLPDILTAGWTYMVARLEAGGNWGNSEDYDLLHRLVLKACESRYVQTIWGPKLRTAES